MRTFFIWRSYHSKKSGGCGKWAWHDGKHEGIYCPHCAVSFDVYGQGRHRKYLIKKTVEN